MACDPNRKGRCFQGGLIHSNKDNRQQGDQVILNAFNTKYNS